MNTDSLKLTVLALRGQGIRTILTTAGVAAATMLVIMLLATHKSLTNGVHLFAGREDVDLWVAPRGTDNLIRSAGFLPSVTEVEEASGAGLINVSPIFRSFVTVESMPQKENPGSQISRKLTLLAIGYKTSGGLGGPNSIFEGREIGHPDEVVIDRAAAHRLGIQQGDSIYVNDWAVKVVGITRGTNLLATQFLFTDIHFIWDSLAMWDYASFILVQLAEGTDTADTATAIREKFPDVNVISRSAFVENNLREVVSGFMPVFGLVTVLGISVAVVLVILLIQGLVEDRRADIAVLFALGQSVRVVGLSLVKRAALLVISGSITGVIMAVTLSETLSHFAPQIEFTYSALHVGFACLLFLAAGVLSSVIPALRLRKIEPLEAFRA